jgi:lipoate-protein ligase B
VTTRALDRVDLGEVPYAEAIASMSERVRQRRAGLILDRLVLLSHPPVITYAASRDSRPRLGSVGGGGGVASHGFAPDLTAFTACGLPDVAMTSPAEMVAASGRPTPDENIVRSAVAEELGAG